MMVDIIEDVNPRYLRNPIAKENVNKDLNEFENEVKGVFPRA